MDDLVAAWQDMLDALSDFAPVTRAALRPPVPPDPAVDASFLYPLAPQLVTWFSLHDGVDEWWETGMLFPWGYPLSCGEAALSTAVNRSVDEAQQPEGYGPLPSRAGTVCGVWHEAYVVVVEDGGGGGLFVDQRPGELHGCVRYWFSEVADMRAGPKARDMAHLLRSVTASLLTGEPLAGRRPTADGEVLEWLTA